jgi:hypothetical protein
MAVNSHNYEFLDPEQFQMLVQALLVREFPDVQCYPVALPDGGRDATHHDADGKPYEAFQVKMSRNPSALADPYKWLTDSVEGELPKISRLADSGYQRYRFITNLRGTPHLDVGLMDKFSRYLNERSPVPASIWWRDDLDRRLEGNFDLKMRYPGILSGPDVIRAAWENGPQLADSKRRRRTLDAYMKGQYEEDHTVRFKQIDLESSQLFDLFIDVPIEPLRRYTMTVSNRRLRNYRIVLDGDITSSAFSQFIRYSDHHDGAILSYTDADRIGAASFLTRPSWQDAARMCVIEGAPGQGKTTLTQYLVQLHRCRLLNRQTDIAKLPEDHASSPVLFPFKMELRDLSQWLRGFYPWSSDEMRHSEPRTLEAAFAAHVQRFSGGSDFSVEDFRESITETPTLLILDALDEVADISDRKNVVAEIRGAINRFEGTDSLRVIVTSRPSIVSGAAVLPEESFLHLGLASLDTQSALNYAEKWARARKLRDTTRKKVCTTLRERIRAPHIAELARNTMQLSILLNLIHMHGESLPSKRTEMYDNYVDLFFGREVEKSDVVREHRKILERIHRFLGYKLHANAEVSRGTGRVSESELRSLICEYLRSIDRPEALVDTLYFGIAERVVALVSRVEGTYEFEVQPLREYFAARYLYDTAPYSPPGREVTGTKPARFEGIARDPYWLNVTRFFAGCFSDGELLDLAERVVELIDDPAFRNDSYPLRLAVALLQDLVFNQSQKATDRLVNVLIRPENLAWLARAEPKDESIPPPDAGADSVVRTAWARLQTTTNESQVQELAGLIARHADLDARHQLWLSYVRPVGGVSPTSLAGHLALKFRSNPPTSQIYVYNLRTPQTDLTTTRRRYDGRWQVSTTNCSVRPSHPVGFRRFSNVSHCRPASYRSSATHRIHRHFAISHQLPAKCSC